MPEFEEPTETDPNEKYTVKDFVVDVVLLPFLPIAWILGKLYQKYN
jgi:hypothetical protein